MAIPLMLGNIYRTIASYGYKTARAMRPSKVKKVLKPAYDKATKPAFEGTKFASGEAKMIKGIKGVSQKGYEGYRKLYGSTLGTSARRKTTSAGLGGYVIGSFLAGDDYED